MTEGHVANGRNLLLAKLLGEAEGQAAGLERVSLTIRQRLYEPGTPIEHVYFPVNGVVSMLAQVEEGVLVEVATIGNEGMIGLALFLGDDTTPGVAFSQVPGDAFRLGAAEFRKMIEPGSSFTDVLHRYTQALMTQISQGNACNRAHSNEQRCARWLLLTHDRVGREEFALTQEFLGQMLGVRRATVNEIAGKFADQAIIGYTRGVIRILDRSRLEAASCRCYRIIRDEYERMYRNINRA